MNNLMSLRSIFARVSVCFVFSIFIIFSFSFGGARSAVADEIRVAALKFGTINWVLDVIKTANLMRNILFK